MRAWLAVALLAACQKQAGPAPAPVPPPPTAEAAPSGTLAAKRPGLDTAASVVELPCVGSNGTGFFVSDSQVLTRLHFICPDDEALRVKLPDGRTLLGKLRWKDEVLDAAVVEVEGGEGVALTAGDASAVVLSGLLRGAKLKDDAVSEYARLYFAVEYPEDVPLEGSPVLDEQGRVVAMVARRVDLHRVLALPLPVLGEAGAKINAPATRWSEIEQRARPAAEAEVRTAREALSRGIVASVQLDSDGKLFALVVRQQNLATAPFKLTLGSCVTDITTAAWEPFDARDAIELGSRRLFAYLVRAKLDAGAVTSLIRLEGCKVNRGMAVVAGEGKTPFEQTVVGQLERTLQPTQGPERAPVEAAAPFAPMEPSGHPRSPSQEREWRQRYREVHRRLADVERSIEDDKRFIDYADHRGNDVRMPMWRLSPAERQRYDEAKERLKHADEQREKVRAELDELDREAANAAVPLEWRR